MQKKLKLFKDGEHVQTLTFTRQAKDHWLCTGRDHKKFMPVQMHKPASEIKKDLIRQGYQWEWV